MSGTSTSAHDDIPKLFDGDEIEALVRERQRAHEANTPVKHPWPVVAEHFPRVAQAIFDLWGSPECDTYLTRLIIDDRGSRAGFPAEVLRALLDLSQQHQGQFGVAVSGPIWLDDPLSPRRIA
jgi:hypothetical protein